jgi:N-acetylneuraminic acid mutarotase
MTKGLFTILLGLTVVVFASDTFAQGIWTTKEPMPTARTVAAAGVVNGIIYVAGGEVANNCSPVHTLESYDPAIDSWTTLAPMPTARWRFAAAVTGGVFYALGGHGGCGGGLPTNEAYDPATNTWTPKAPMPAARCCLAAAAVNGIVYAIGGEGDGTRVDAYDPATDTWTPKAPMPRAHLGHAAAVVNGIIYVVGGQDYAIGALATVEAYDPATNSWTSKPSMSTVRFWWPGAGAVAGRLYVVGGWSSADPTTTFEAYDPATNAWSGRPDPLIAHGSLAGAAVVGDAFYAIGGFTGGSGYLATNEAFTPVIEASIDIHPGSFPNSINLKSKGKIPVAILSSPTFDAPSSVDTSSLTFGRTGNEASLAFCGTIPQDVNGDGFLDLVCHFSNQAAGFQAGDTQGILKGQTVSGIPLMGTDSVRIVP